MYAHFYHLAECPFNLTPDPKFHYINESTQEAMASILYGIESRKGFLTLIGEAGTGKTTLLKRVVEEVEGDARVVFVFNPGVTFDELLEYICTELGIGVEGCRRLTLLEKLNEFLLEQLTAGKNVVVMIDEAQTLDDAVLEELRLLSNLETSKEKILQILLSGQPELGEKLRKPGLRQLRQRIGTRAALKPMLAKEIGPYIETRLRSAGSEEGQIFTNKAIRGIYRCSGGIPRVVNVICDNAMMIAFAEGRKRVNAKVVNEAIRDLDGVESSGASLGDFRSWLAMPAVRMAGAAVAAVLVAVPFAMSLFGGDQDRVAVEDAERPAVTAEESPRVLARANAPTRPLETSRDAASPQLPLTQPSDQGVLVDRLPGTQPPPLPSPTARVQVEPTPVSARDDHRVLHETMSDRILRDTIRRAEVLARSTAARLYADSGEPGAHRLSTATPSAISAPAPSRMRTSPPVVAEPQTRPSPQVADSAPPAAQPRVVAAQGGAVATTQPQRDRIAVAGQQLPADSTLNRPIESREVPATPRPGTNARPAATTAAPRVAVAPQPASSVAAPKAAVEPEVAVASSVSKPVEAVEPVRRQPEVRPIEEAPIVRTEAVRQTAPVEAVKLPVAPEKTEPSVEIASLAPSLAVPAERSRKRASVVLGPARGYPLVGRLVDVTDGDTVWDIAYKYYGYAGPRTLSAILDKNPELKNPRRLVVGDRLYLPFLKPTQMVRSAPDGSYSVLISSSPTESGVRSAREWIGAAMPELELVSGTGQGESAAYVLYASGFTSKQEALGAADKVLIELSERSSNSRRRRAGESRSRSPRS